MNSLPSPRELRRLRKKAGLTQKELADRAGVSQSLIARIERGSVDPRLSTYMKIIKVLQEALEEKTRAYHVMKTPVITLTPSDTIEKAAQIMWNYGISQIPIIDERGIVVGTIYEDSILKCLLNVKDPTKAKEKKVSDIMDPPLPIVSAETPLETIINILLGGIPAVLVAKKRKIIGIITKSDIIALQFHVKN